MSPQWRRSHRKAVRDVLDRNLLPSFGNRLIGEITKADVLAFRAGSPNCPAAAERPSAMRGSTKIMCFLRQILNERRIVLI